jgi:hypothetical protein
MEKANTTPHVHATVIKAWADGRAVQYYSKKKGRWLRANNPTWRVKTKYRVRTADFIVGLESSCGAYVVDVLFDGVTKQPIRIDN